nr:hypothetical protein [uncultured archaeon]
MFLIRCIVEERKCLFHCSMLSIHFVVFCCSFFQIILLFYICFLLLYFFFLKYIGRHIFHLDFDILHPSGRENFRRELLCFLPRWSMLCLVFFHLARYLFLRLELYLCIIVLLETWNFLSLLIL